MHPRHPLRWQRERCDRGLWEGCSCDTPATHSELRNEPRQGCSYTVERDRGGRSVCPLSLRLLSTRVIWGLRACSTSSSPLQNSELICVSPYSAVSELGLRTLLLLTAFKIAPDPKLVQKLSRRLFFGFPIRGTQIC